MASSPTSQANDGRLASVQPDGTLQNNPVGFSYHAVERMAAGVAAASVAEPVGA